MKKCFFLRGLVREAGHWSGFLERFESAFPGWKAVPLDIPGNGIRFQEKSPWSVPRMVEIMRQEFLRQRGEENFLFAISLGGMVGVEWMRSFPEDFRKAILVNTSFRGFSPFYHRLCPGNYFHIIAMMIRRDLAFRERGILEITSRRPELFERLAPEWVEIQRARPVSVCNAFRQIIAAARFHPPAQKPATALLLLNGARDGLVSPLCSQAIASRWGVPIEVHPEAGHDLTLDAPEWAIEKLRKFFGE